MIPFVFLIVGIAAGPLLQAQPNTNEFQPAIPKHLPLLSRPSSLTNIVGNGTNTQDVYGALLRWTIEDTTRKLQQTNLNATYRESLERILASQQGTLSNHLAQLQEREDFIKSLRANPRTAWTNMPDPMQQELQANIARYEAELANTSITTNLRISYQHLLIDYENKLADHETNAQLWANLRLAEQNGNREQRMLARRELADYLAKQLGKMQGRSYPTGMSLEAIAAAYQKQVHGSTWFETRIVVRIVLCVILLLPAAVITAAALKKRFPK